MDYTKDVELMKILTELADEIQGFNYTIKSDWKSNETVISSRISSTNKAIEKVKEYFNKEGNKHEN